MARSANRTGLRAVLAFAKPGLRRLRHTARRTVMAWRAWYKARAVRLAELARHADPTATPDFVVLCGSDGADGALACVRSILAGALPPGRIVVVASAPMDIAYESLAYESPADGGLLEAVRRAVESCPRRQVVVCDAAATFAPEALLWLATVAKQHPHLKALYADHEITAGSRARRRRRGVHSKPSFSWIYLLARDFVWPFVMYDRDTLVKALPALQSRPPLWRSTRGLLYALALEITSGSERSEIVHVPHPLAAAADDRAIDGEELADICRAAIAGRGATATVTPTPGEPRVRQLRLVPPAAPHVSIIIPTKNGADLIERCVSSLRSTAGYEHYDILVIDHESDETRLRDYLAAESRAGSLRVMPYAGPFNFAAMNNLAVKQVAGELLLFLNNDVENFSAGWLAALVATLSLDSRLAAVGALLFFPEGTVQHAGVVLTPKRQCQHVYHGLPPSAAGYRGRLRSLQEYLAVTGAVMLVRRDAFDQIGGFDERFPNDYNDVDFCLRLRQAGYGIAFNPLASATHWESYTRTAREAGKDLFLTRWNHLFPHDPFHHAGMGAVGFWPASDVRLARALSRLALAEAVGNLCDGR